MKYRREIDGLRAVAVLPVILFHAGLSAFGGGFVGVDVFFVISGYLITSIILIERSEGNFSIARFYERRARRILPALFLVLFSCVFAAWLWLPPKDMVSFCKSLIAVSFFGSNFLFWSESGYFDLAAELKPLLHTWSLAVEEQFYLLFPLLLGLVSSRGARSLRGRIALLGIFSLAAAQVETSTHPMAAFYLLPTRGWELLIGAWVALYRINRPQRAKDTALWAFVYDTSSLVGLALVIGSVFVFDKETPFPSVYALVPTVGTALFILFADGRTIAGRLLSLRWFVGAGLVSYSAYLWHYPLFAFARHASVAVPGIGTFSILSVLAFVLAYLSWRFVEQPFRTREQVTPKTVVAFSLLGIVCFSSFGLVGILTDGFAVVRLTPEMKKVMDVMSMSPRRKECLYEPGVSGPKIPCVHNEGKITWAVLGDSHASELAWVLGQSIKERGEALKQFSSQEKPSFNPACIGDDECKTWTERSIDQIVADPGIRNVVVTYRINWYLFGDHRPTYPILPNQESETERQRRWGYYVEVLKRLAQSDKRIILLLQVPEVRKPLPDLIFQNPLSLDTIAGVSREWWSGRTAYVSVRLTELPSSVVIVDPADILCDHASCFAVQDGVSLYLDDNHLSLAGASKVAARILELAVPASPK